MSRHSVCIVSGSFGDGHDAAAREIKRRLADHGIDAVILDIVDLYPWHLGPLVKWAYLWQMRHLPRTWRWLLALLEITPTHRRRMPGRAATRGLTVRCIGSASRRLRPVPAMFDAVISTHPFASQAIGQLARQGRMSSTATLTYLTDLSVHSLWISPAVDRHLALHPVTASDACALGARAVSVVRPALRTIHHGSGLNPEARRECRATFGLPALGRLALVTGGAEGVGDLVATARDLLTLGDDLTPVVLCGRNETLRRRLTKDPRTIPLGWVNDMDGLYAAVDLVVQNAGGSTSLEALAAGLPVVSYRCLPGHGETNAANLARAGLIPWARSLHDLEMAIAGRPTTSSLPDVSVSSASSPRSESTVAPQAQVSTGRCVGAVIAELVVSA